MKFSFPDIATVKVTNISKLYAMMSFIVEFCLFSSKYGLCLLNIPHSHSAHNKELGKMEGEDFHTVSAGSASLSAERASQRSQIITRCCALICVGLAVIDCKSLLLSLTSAHLWNFNTCIFKGYC